MLDADLARKADELLAEMRKANAAFEQDGGQDRARDGQKAITDKLVANDQKQEKRSGKKAKLSKRDQMYEAATKAVIDGLHSPSKADRQKAEIEEAVKAALAGMRGPSMAALIGDGRKGRDESDGRRKITALGKPFPALKASFTKYQAGEFIDALVKAKGIEFEPGDRFNPARYQEGMKAIGKFATWAGPPDMVKATLGTTGATGGYVLPNNLVDSVVKPSTQAAVYQLLVTPRNNIAVRGVDMPYRLGAPARMAFQDWGVTKQNVNETYGSYTAYLGTIARIYDASKQYLRFSAGSAEEDIMDELTRGAILGENFYVLAGAGTGTIGSGDPTTGVYTALQSAAPTYSSTATPAPSTIIGSAATAFTVMLSALASRSRVAVDIVVDAVTFYTIIAQGTDAAGFFLSPTGGPGQITVGGEATSLHKTQAGELDMWGKRIFYDANFNTNTGTTKGAIAGEWKEVKLFRGIEFRIDTSDTAGTRWDQNLVGFRGEEEIGVNASTPVAVGAFQWCGNVLP